MHRVAGQLLRPALARCTLPAFAIRSSAGFPTVFRAEIRFSRVKVHEDAALKPPPADSLPAPAHPAASSTTSTSVVTSSRSGSDDASRSPIAVPTPVAPPSNTSSQHVQRTRCPLGIIRYVALETDAQCPRAHARRCGHNAFKIRYFRHKTWEGMDSETRYHWRSLGWGPDSWANGPNPASTSVRACPSPAPHFTPSCSVKATPKSGRS